MNKLKKIGIGIIACLFGVLFLMLAAVLIAPKVVDTKTVRDKLRSEIKQTSGVEIDFKHLILDFFPHPHVIFDQVTLSMLPVVRGKAASVRVHPKILPLFLGKMQIAGLRLDSAELNYTLPIRSATVKRASQPFSLNDLGKKVQSMVSTLPEFKIPDLDFQVINSRVSLFDSGRKILALKSVNSHLEGPLTGRKITLDCKSNLWQRISMSGLLNTRTFKGIGQVQLTQFQPQDLAAYLFPDSPVRITDAPANLTIDFKTDEPGKLQAEAHGSTPHLKLRCAKETPNIKNARFKASCQVDKDAITLSLTELALDYPRLNLSANLALTQTTPLLSLQVKGTQIDVASTRQVALTLSGKNNVVKDIFDIVKGGSIPSITLKAKGNSLSDLGNMDNMVIQGQLYDGVIRIPDIQFDLKDFAGEVVISRGILQGENLRARLCGISMAGTLKVSPPNVEFDLEAIAKDHELNPTKTCLVGETFKADGTYNLKGRFQGLGKAEDLLKTATGQVEFTAKDGHIYHDIILVNVLKYLNTFKVFTGKVNFKDMEKKGFGYHSFRVKAKLQDGKLRYEEAILHGLPMTVTAAGENDLQNGRIDLTLLVAPLVTLDRIFEHIPLIGGIPDNLDTIPLSVKGTLDNIHIYPLAPSAVWYELKEMMKKTVERPINLIRGGKTPEQN